MPPHTCRKEGRSCLRNIISFCRIPGRKVFRRIGRAFMHGLILVAPGYGIRDLSRGKAIILKRLSEQHPRHSTRPRCLRCGEYLDEPTQYTAAAGQTFEMIKPRRMAGAFRIISESIQILTGRRDPTLSCMHTTKSNVRFGGWIRDTLLDRSVFYSSKVSSCMRSLLELRWYKLGDRYLVQVPGIPLGGPVSGAALETVLCVDEDTFDKFGWREFAKPLNIPGNDGFGSPSLATSTMWLRPQGGCVPGVLSTLYTVSMAGPLPSMLPTMVKVPFMGTMWCVSLTYDVFLIGRKHFPLVYKNDLFVFSGHAQLNTKVRFPIPQGDRHVFTRRIRCEF